jgi:hypothetical protein
VTLASRTAAQGNAQRGTDVACSGAMPTRDDDAGVDRIQRVAFDYFVRYVGAHGLALDTSREGSPSSIAAVGLALASYAVGVERGWMTRREAAARTRETLRFFRDAPNDGGPTASGFMGLYYHFLDGKTATRAGHSEVSLVDSAFLVAGMLTAQAYFGGTNAIEREIRALTDELHRRVNWRWARSESLTLAHGWKPECGFLHYGWEGYSEAMLLYVLALGSPTHPVERESYLGWNGTYQWESHYDRSFLYAGPLFVHQFSHAWIDFRGIRDDFMRKTGSDYFENTRCAIHVQREYCRRNPREHAGYGEDAWGLSACEGPGAGPDALDYTARGVPFGPDDGVLCPASMIASLPFEPELTLRAIAHLRAHHPQVLDGDRVPGSYRPSRSGSEGGWISSARFGLDQGLVVLMIENHRSGLIWELMRDCAPIERGLRRAGFTGGWLSRRKPRRKERP